MKKKHLSALRDLGLRISACLCIFWSAKLAIFFSNIASDIILQTKKYLIY